MKTTSQAPVVLITGVLAGIGRATAETLQGFAEYVGQQSKTRNGIKSWFDALDLDDYTSFGGKP